MKPEPLQIIGSPRLRVDSKDKVRGRATYVDDMFLPNTLFAKLKRSNFAHARIKNVDTSKALALDGVVAVLTGRDLPVKYGILPVTQDENALAVEKARFVGDPVAAVCAETELIAQRAVQLIDVEYEPLDAILSVHDAFAAKSRVHESPKFQGNAGRVVAFEFGDVEPAFEDCGYTRDDMFWFAGNTHVPMETHATLADYDGTRLTLHISHQAPYYVQKILPDVLGLPAQFLRVVVPYVGGGFGGKLDPFSDTICAGKFSMMTGRPVKLTLEREEVFYNHRGRHATLMWIKTGFQGTRVRALHFKAFIDGGAYGSFGTAASYYHAALQPTTYRLPNYKAEVVRFYTNKPPCGPKRGHGTPQPRFAVECHLDKVAEDLGVSPHEIRSANLTKPNSITTNHLRITTSDLAECMRRVIEESQYESRRNDLPFGKGLGFAVGCYLSGAGLPIYWNDMPHSEVIVKADRSGTITAYSGHTEIGQGSDTVLAFIIAECLGLEPEDVALVLRDSDAVPPDLGSYSSRVTLMMGNAAQDAAIKLRESLAEAAAVLLEVPKEQLGFRERRIVDRKSVDDRSVSIEEAIVKAEEAHGVLTFTGNYRPEIEFGKFKGAGVGPSPTYSFAACVTEVDVDLATGLVSPKRIWMAHDIGRCIHRKAVEGQVEGGIYMALGEVLMEEMEHTKTGSLKNAGLLDYKTPTIRETPEIEIYLLENGDPAGPFGAKEVGQGPLLPVIPSVSNAVYNAIGVRFDEIPITPDKVLRALERKESRVGPRRLVDFEFPEPVRAEVPSDASS